MSSSDGMSMSLDESRIREIPSLEGLEKVERHLHSQERSSEKNILEDFTQGEIVKRLAKRDDRLEGASYTLQGNTFDYGDMRGRIDSFSGEINVSTFEPGEEDFSVQTALRIGGAKSGRTMHSKAVSTYRSALQNAGYDAEELDEEVLQETASQALEDMNYDSFSVEIDDSTREAYDKAVQKIKG